MNILSRHPSHSSATLSIYSPIPLVALHHPPRLRVDLLAQLGWREHLYVGAPAKHPRAHLADPADTHRQLAAAVGCVLDALAVVPDALFDARGDGWREAQPHLDL